MQNNGWTGRFFGGDAITGRAPLTAPNGGYGRKVAVAVESDSTQAAPVVRVINTLPPEQASAARQYFATAFARHIRQALARRTQAHIRSTNLLLQLDFYGPRGEIEVTASYTFDEACRGARERTGVALEPDTPAEVHLISLVTERGGVDLLPALDEALVRDVRMQILDEELHGR